MLVLLIGIVCAWAAHRATSGRGLAPRAALAATVLVAAAVTFQVWSAREPLRQYRFSLLGLRYAATAPDGTPSSDTLRLGGDYETADVYVAGAGNTAVATVHATGDSVRRVVEVTAADDAASAVLVHEERFLRERVRVLGSRRLAETDTIRLRGSGGLALAVDMRGRTHRVRSRASQRSVELPAPNRNWRDRVRRPRLGPLQRTYPLADILEALGESGGDDLSSFFFYEGGRLAFADLDSEVELSGAPAAATDTLWSSDGPERRVTVAGLPYRDYADLDLTAPERYGLRPLRTGRFRINGPWLDFRLSLPEIRSFDSVALKQLSLDSRSGRKSCVPPDRAYRVHVSPVRQNLTRQAVTFAAPPRRFESASQAVVSLPCDFSAGGFRILSPSGPVDGRSGTPFTVGDGRREVILRVDAKRMGAGGLLLVFVVLVAPALLFTRLSVPELVRALAVCATGLVGVRLLLGLGAAVEYPFLQEANQTGLWFAAVLPWTVLLAGMDRGARYAPPAWAAPAQLAYGLLLTGFAGAVFVDSPAKQAVLSAVSLGIALLAYPEVRRLSARMVAFVRSQRWRERARGVEAWLCRAVPARGGRRGIVRGALLFVSSAVRRIFARFPGTAFGVLLFLSRTILAAVGMSEAVEVAGTRVGISVFYTPLSLALLVHVVRCHERRAATAAALSSARASGGVERRRGLSAAARLADLWAYLGFAFVATAGLISDLGLALTTLPGALVFLLLLADRWFPVPPGGWLAAFRPQRVALALPLALFVLLQAQPRLALPAGDPSQPQFRMQQWSTSKLRLLDRGDPAALQLIGQRRSEALGAMSETMRAYTRGPLTGPGYFNGKVSAELRATAAQEHAVSALLVGQWGLPGAVGLVLLLSALLAPVALWWRNAATRPRWQGTGVFACAGVLAALLLASVALPQSGAWRLATLGLLVLGTGAGVLAWVVGEPAPFPADTRGNLLAAGPAVAALFLLTVCGAGLYMVLANYGLVLFTGKNVYGLGLDSIGDMLETLALLALTSHFLRAFPPGAPTEGAP